MYLKKEVLASNKRFAHYLLILGFIFLETLAINIFGAQSANPLIVFGSLMFFVLCLALPPAMYLYVVSLVRTSTSGDILKNSLKHYIPAFVLFVINIFCFVALYNIETGSENYELFDVIRTYSNFIALFFVFLFQNIFYIYLSFRLYQKRQVILQGTQNVDSNNTLKWMMWFLISFTFLILILYGFQLKPLASGKIVLRLILLIYVIVIIYFGNKNLEFDTEKTNDQKLDSSKRKEISDKLTTLMTNEKPFLDSSLNIHSLAQQVQTNTKYLSHVINQEFNLNFSSYINKYRIMESKSMLIDPDNEKYTIETIAQMTGFNSKSAFNTAFKKFLEQTPSQFRKLNIN